MKLNKEVSVGVQSLGRPKADMTHATVASGLGQGLAGVAKQLQTYYETESKLEGTANATKFATELNNYQTELNAKKSYAWGDSLPDGTMVNSLLSGEDLEKYRPKIADDGTEMASSIPAFTVRSQVFALEQERLTKNYGGGLAKAGHLRFQELTRGYAVAANAGVAKTNVTDRNNHLFVKHQEVLDGIMTSPQPLEVKEAQARAQIDDAYLSGYMDEVQLRQQNNLLDKQLKDEVVGQVYQMLDKGDTAGAQAFVSANDDRFIGDTTSYIRLQAAIDSKAESQLVTSIADEALKRFPKPKDAKKAHEYVLSMSEDNDIRNQSMAQYNAGISASKREKAETQADLYHKSHNLIREQEGKGDMESIVGSRQLSQMKPSQQEALRGLHNSFSSGKTNADLFPVVSSSAYIDFFSLSTEKQAVYSLDSLIKDGRYTVTKADYNKIQEAIIDAKKGGDDPKHQVITTSSTQAKRVLSELYDNDYKDLSDDDKTRYRTVEAHVQSALEKAARDKGEALIPSEVNGVMKEFLSTVETDEWSWFIGADTYNLSDVDMDDLQAKSIQAMTDQGISEDDAIAAFNAMTPTQLIKRHLKMQGKTIKGQ